MNFVWAMRPTVAICSARIDGALLGHHHVLVPAEESGGLDEIRDLGEALPQVVELGLAHAAKPI